MPVLTLLPGIKLNAVIWVNDDQLLPLADLARAQGLELRLIEYMDVGNRNQWRLEQVLPAAMLERIPVALEFWSPEVRRRGGYADGAIDRCDRLHHGRSVETATAP